MSTTKPTPPPRRPTREEPEMEGRTPGTVQINPLAGQEARVLTGPIAAGPTMGSAAARRGVRHVLCEGRKRTSGRTQPNQGEHIDLIVPDPAENAAAVEEFLDPVNQVGMTPEQRAQVLAGHNADTIHIAGQHYHFVGGEVSDVLAQHVPWLEQHPIFNFRVVSE